MENRDWMEKLSPNLKNTSICYIAIPGSHDSLSYSVNHRSSLSPDAPKVAKLLSKVCGPLMRRITYNWCVTQTVDIEQQFLLGIRYFDLRIATKGLKLYSCHALYGMNILKALRILDDLLNLYTKEIIILDFQHFYDLSTSDHLFLIERIHSIFGNKLCAPRNDVSSLTIHQLQTDGHRVIVVYRNEWVNNVPNFWPSSKWITLWPNTTNITQLCKYLTETLKQRPKNAGFVSQCLFTPSPKFIICHLLSTLKDRCGIECDTKIKSLWIENQRSLNPKGVNVIIADFIDLNEFNFCSSVIKLNKKNLLVRA